MPAPDPQKQAREARLAAQLRANLKRRKEHAKPPALPEDPDER